jgi:C-terminal processing protease CtpA/Prc
VARSFATTVIRLAVLVAAAGCAAQARPAWPPPQRAAGPYHDPDLARGPLPGEAARRTELALVRDHLDRMYAHRAEKIARYHLDEAQLFADAERRLVAARTWAQIDAALYGVLVPFHDGHLSYHPPPTAAPARGYASFHLGLETVLAGDHLLVASIEPGTDVARAGVAPGDEVIAIDGKPVADALAAAVDGRAWSRPESAKTTWAGTWTHALYPLGDPPRARRIDVATRDGRKLSVAIAPREAPKQKKPPVTTAQVGQVTVITIPSLEGNRDKATAIDEALAGARGAAALVLDLRGDRGGVDFIGQRLVADLAEGHAPLATYRVLVAPETLARRPRWKELTAEPDGFSPPQPLAVDAQPANQGFHGKLAVVIDAGCVSTCEMIAAALRADLHATLVGETTGGSSGAPVEVALPASHGKLAIPTWNLVAADGKPIEGDGVVPDVPVVATPDALAAGIDLPLQTAIDRVKP